MLFANGIAGTVSVACARPFPSRLGGERNGKNEGGGKANCKEIKVAPFPPIETEAVALSPLLPDRLGDALCSVRRAVI
jgi:hypothetical protein